MGSAIAFANAHGADRIAAVGVLGLRALRHVAQGRPAAGPPIPGLSLVAEGAGERPGWHPSTGLYGFLRLPPGPRRITLRDPAARFQAAAFDVVVPDRAAVRAALERGEAKPAMAPRPLLRDLALHESPTAPIPPGITAVFGQVRDAAGRPVALARLALNTLIEGAMRRHLAWSAADGSFALRLPGERPDTIGGDPPWRVNRALLVHAPRAPLAAALARDFVAALPAERDALDPDDAAGPFERRGFALRSGDGTLRSGSGGADPTLPLLGGRGARWDIELA
jgi:hypothetical protein